MGAAFLFSGGLKWKKPPGVAPDSFNKVHVMQYNPQTESVQDPDILLDDLPSARGQVVPFRSEPENLNVALSLAARGLAVFPVRDWGDGGGWKPIKGFPVQATTDPDRIREWWRRWPEARVALLTGERNGISVLDVDMKNAKSGMASLAALGFPDIRALSPVLTRTPSGGWHVFFRYKPGLKATVGKIGLGLDVRNNGGFVIAPGSLKEGAAYTVEGVHLRRDMDLPEWPDALTPPAAPEREPVEAREATEAQQEWAAEQLNRWAERVAGAPEGRRQSTLNDAAFWAGGAGAHGALSRDDAEAALVEAGTACGLSEGEARRSFAHGWTGGLAKPVALPFAADADDFDDLDDELLIDDLPARKCLLPEWRGFKPMRNSEGNLIPNLASAVWGLGNALEQNGWSLRYNEFTRRNECNGVPLDDASASLIRVAIQRARLGLEHIGKQTCDEAIELGARGARYHPVRDYLNALRWDGNKRIGGFLSCYFGARDDAYTRGVGRAFLIAMVARVMQPGCKHDCALIFIGSQGAGKSTAAKILAGGDEWFSDSLPKVTDDSVEAKRHLPGKWLIEIGEMSALSKSDANAIKAFLSGSVDDVRFPYAKRDEKVPRECVFIGTANDPECLRDETGNRRFWPVKVRASVDLDALRRDRDQLLAEAVHAYRAGEQWHLTPELEALARLEQEVARAPDVWEDPIREWLQRGESIGDDFESGTLSQPYQRVKLSAVLKGAVGIDTARQGRAEQNRASAVLRALGWTRKAFEDGKYWVAPASDPG